MFISYRVLMVVDGTEFNVGSGLSLQQAHKISGDLFEALVDSMGTRVSAWVEKEQR